MWSKVVQDLFRQPTRMCFFVFVKIVSPGCPCDLFQVDDDNQVTITTDSLMVQSLGMHTSHARKVSPQELPACMCLSS